MTEWRAVPGFPDYQVSSEGSVRRSSPANGTRPGKILKPKLTKQGYHEVGIRRDGRCYYRRINRLVCEAWHGPAPADRPFACHKNDHPHDDRPSNLYWGDRLENASDALKNDRYPRGERCGSSRYPEATIVALKLERAATGASIDVLSNKYGVSRSQVSKILRGQYWAHVA